MSPDDSFIAQLDKRWTKRNIQIRQVMDLTQIEFPIFIKSVIPKLFQAGVFQTLKDFYEIAKGVAGSEEILISEIVHIEAEVRSYVLDGRIKDIAIYEGTGDITVGRKFLEDFIQDHASRLPKTVVIDTAYNTSLGWIILEFNACWGAGLNGCSAEKVIDCIISATENNR